jgi:hypothetical protein
MGIYNMSVYNKIEIEYINNNDKNKWYSIWAIINKNIIILIIFIFW